MEQTKRGGGGNKFVDGQFERFYAGEIPLWINISAHALYEQEVYDRSSKEVVKTQTTWFEWQKHYIPRNKGRKDRNGRKVDQGFVCSCGPYKKLPCWGCAVRKAHFDKLNAIQEKTGVRPEDNAPISRINQFSLAITVMEKIYAVPMRDGNGTIRKAKSTGQILYRYTPAPVADARADTNEAVEELKGLKYQFGHNMHWTLGAEELAVLIAADDKMKNHCGNCADQLMAKAMICPGCETRVSLPGYVSGVDLTTERNKNRVCSACGEKGPFQPALDCAACGEAVEGRLTSFDIRVQRTELVGSDKKKTYRTEILAVRVPGVPGNQADHERAMKLIENPMDLSLIFAPRNLDSQKFLCGDELTKGLRADLAVVREEDESSDTDTEAYTGTEESEEETNQSIAF